MRSLAQDPAFDVLDEWLETTIAKHEVRRVLRDLKLAELEMLLVLLQKARRSSETPETPNDGAEKGLPARPEDSR